MQMKAALGRRVGHRTNLIVDTARQEVGTNVILSAPRQGRQESNGRMEGPCRPGGEAAGKMQ